MQNTSTEKQVQVDEEFAAIRNNISAVLAVSSSVERTLGPKGLDTMLVDRFGDVLVTNSGVTILERMDASHPAARMLLNVAQSQHAAVGDGTTTATVMASAVLKEGLNQISRGVPVSRLLEGINQAAQDAVGILQTEIRRSVKRLDDPRLLAVARIAGRGDRQVASWIAQAAKSVGKERLLESSFKLADIVLTREFGQDQLIDGLVLLKGRISYSTPRRVSPCKILVLEDSLSPEEIEEEALRTEAGFQKSLELKNRFLQNLQKLHSLGVNVILTQGGVHPEAEEFLAHSQIPLIRRLNSRELQEAAGATGAKPVKRSGLNREAKLLKEFLGEATLFEEDEKTHLTIITGGKGQPRATLLLGANTRQVAEEKERKAKDAAASFQNAFQEGMVPGGGATELALARFLQRRRNRYKAMTSYGLDCVLEGLKKPFLQMAANAGFNPLEKAEEVLTAQSKQQKDSISLDFETGALADMEVHQIMDPLKVKLHALASASEISQAILRINRIIKMRENGSPGTDHV